MINNTSIFLWVVWYSPNQKFF